jgi:hypothetical protein
MSNSQYKEFMQCEARAMARLNGWQDKSSDSLLVGSYVHAWNEGTLDKFRDENPEIFTKAGDLKAPFQKAHDMINVLESDPLITAALKGAKEVIRTAEWGGCVWKVKFDSLNARRGNFSDLKTCKSINETVWLPGEQRRVHFIEAYGYITQAAIYAKTEAEYMKRKELLEPYWILISKEDPPDKAILTFSKDRLEEEIDKVLSNLPRILAVKSGDIAPNRCGQCEYCRASKKLDKVIDFDEFIFGEVPF